MNAQPVRKYHLGCTGWSLTEWKGRLFTEDAQPDDFLRQYATVFNSVEGNTTFYNIPDPVTVKKWGDAVPEGFKFCFKFHRSITHDKKLHDAGDNIRSFISRFEPISDKLGPFMIQLPPEFSYEHIQDLEEALAILPPSYHYAVEVRHPDFFDQGRKENSLNRMLESYNVDRINFDTRKLHSLKLGDDTEMQAQQRKPKGPVRFVTTGAKPFIRYVGTNDVLNNEIYLKEWAIVLADWIKEGKKPYLFTHAPNKVNQPQIGRKFHQILSEFVDVKPLPDWPADRKDKQQELF